MQISLPEYTLLINNELYIKCGTYPRSILSKPLLYQAMQGERNSNNSKLIPLSEISINKISKVKPKALIFHCSRCGSTLISQMIDLLSNSLVISEADVISSYLLLCLEDKIEFSTLDFKKLIYLFIQEFSEDNDVIIKFSSWNVLLINHILQTFPDVPWIYVNRNWEEVIQSNLKKHTAPLRWMATNKSIAAICAGMDVNKLTNYNQEAFFKQCLLNYNRIVNDVKDINNNGIIIDYLNIKKEIFEICSNHFELNISPIEYENMLIRMSINSKFPEKGKFKSNQQYNTELILN